MYVYGQFHRFTGELFGFCQDMMNLGTAYASCWIPGQFTGNSGSCYPIKEYSTLMTHAVTNWSDFYWVSRDIAETRGLLQYTYDPSLTL